MFKSGIVFYLVDAIRQISCLSFGLIELLLLLKLLTIIEQCHRVMSLFRHKLSLVEYRHQLSKSTQTYFGLESQINKSNTAESEFSISVFSAGAAFCHIHNMRGGRYRQKVKRNQKRVTIKAGTGKIVETNKNKLKQKFPTDIIPTPFRPPSKATSETCECALLVYIGIDSTVALTGQQVNVLAATLLRSTSSHHF